MWLNHYSRKLEKISKTLLSMGVGSHRVVNKT